MPSRVVRWILGTGGPRGAEEGGLATAARALPRRLPPKVLRCLGLHATAVSAWEAIRGRARLPPRPTESRALRCPLPGDSARVPRSNHASGPGQAETSPRATALSSDPDAVSLGLGPGRMDRLSARLETMSGVAPCLSVIIAST